MAKVSVMTPEKAQPAELGGLQALDYFSGAKQPIHLQVVDLPRGAELPLERTTVDCLAYVWSGRIGVSATELSAGSVVIVERGAECTLQGSAPQSRLLLFRAGQAQSKAREGGHVHLLPAERAPCAPNLSSSGVSGRLLADARCPSCEVWLHENRFPAATEKPRDAKAGIHSHSEDEVIFVTEGQIQLGERLYGLGTAIAITADTFYTFLPGPDGMAFVNFRAALPTEIHFASGHVVDETATWAQIDRPLEYLPA
jgi:quercetin dioxygenase-like cupin family protein